MQNKPIKYELPETPSWLIKLLGKPKTTAANSNEAPNQFMATGRRNNDLASLAGFYRRQGLDADSIFIKLMAANSTADEPVSEHEVRGVANSVARNYEPNLRGEFHDLPMSRVIAGMISDVCRYLPDHGWRVYNGRCWIDDKSGVRAKEHIKTQIEKLVASFKANGDPDAVREIRKYLSNNKVSALTALVTSDPEIRADVEDFDRTDDLLNVRNGTLILSTGHLKPHVASDMLTKVANVDFEPGADCPKFRHVLSQSLPTDHAKFLLRYLGYALLGAPVEQVFAILFGAGANGKSTLMNAVSNLLGSYSANVEPASLLKQKNEKIRTDIARLQGVHMAVTSELATGEVLDAALVKRFTGEDKITARSLYSSEIEFVPKFALVMITNALPVIDGADSALARRLILLPFNNVVPESDRDSSLSYHLAAESPGILNLLLMGLHDYRNNGLAVPEDIKVEVARYARSSDMLASFLAEATDDDAAGGVAAAALYQRYTQWCGMNGLRSLSMPQFKREITKKGYSQKRTKSGYTWPGLRLRRPHI